ncbi:MAG: hypothetical protein M1813_001545 [Trichoglossum hirsutum]|nr:MAG: hypothetical protein M1813_001545 [Trichoglossum hirsutum]
MLSVDSEEETKIIPPGVIAFELAKAAGMVTGWPREFVDRIKRAPELGGPDEVRIVLARADGVGATIVGSTGDIPGRVSVIGTAVDNPPGPAKTEKDNNVTGEPEEATDTRVANGAAVNTAGGVGGATIAGPTPGGIEEVMAAGSTTGGVDGVVIAGSTPREIEEVVIAGLAPGGVEGVMIAGSTPGEIEEVVIAGSAPGGVEGVMIAGSTPGEIEEVVIAGSAPGGVEGVMIAGSTPGVAEEVIIAGSAPGGVGGAMGGVAAVPLLRGITVDPTEPLTDGITVILGTMRVEKDDSLGSSVAEEFVVMLIIVTEIPPVALTVGVATH